MRLLLVVMSLLALERAADACCLGCPCTKYKRLDVPVLLTQPAAGYVHSTRGAIPAFSEARIATFLARGTWQPAPTNPHAPGPADLSGRPIQYMPAPTIRFAPPDEAGQPSKLVAQVVLIRRIEKHGRAILVEVDDRVFKLAACPNKKGFACLVDPGPLTLRPIPPPGDEAGQGSSGFAQPPP